MKKSKRADARASGKKLVADFEAVLDKAECTARGVTALESRREQLRTLRDGAGASDLTVGVVGITSSGKSTFLNGLMGEALLPEESRATTNVVVRCRHGPQREVVVLHVNGERTVFRGDQVTPALFKRFSSEKENPGNKLGVRIIEWTTPKTHIPRGLVLVDSPGLDAYGLEEHRDLTLRQVLPMADIVIYMTSIRNPFKGADLALVEKLVENDQRVLFTLTMADTERDSHEGGKVIRTREQKLARHLMRLENDIERHTRLRTFGAVLVSSKLAKIARLDRRSRAWKESNFDAVLEHLDRFARDLGHLGLDSRLRRAEALLDLCIRACSNVLNAEPGSADQALASPKTRIERLRAVRRDVKSAMEQAVAKSNEQLSSDALRRLVADKTWGCSDYDYFNRATQKIREAIDGRKKEMFHRLDSCSKCAAAEMKAEGVALARPSRHQRQLELQEMPDLSAYRAWVPYEVEKKRKIFGIIPWFSTTETKYRDTYDPHAARNDLNIHVDGLARQISTHLNWWTQVQEVGVLNPLQAEIESEQNALEALQRALDAAEQERRDTERARDSLTALREDIRALSKRSKDLQTAAEKSSSPPPRPPDRAPGQPPTAHRALIPLLDAVREQSFQEEVETRLTAFIGKPPRRVLLLGTWRHRGARFLASMAHELSLVDRIDKLPSSHWVLAGDRRGFDFRGPHTVLPVERCVLDRMLVVVAPDDVQLRKKTVRWRRLLSTFDAIGVEIEADRVHSGVADLARAVYREDLKHFGGRVFLTCGHGAAFDDRLAHLVTDVRPALRSFGFGNEVPLIVYEDYDLRYTHFCELAEDMGEQNFDVHHFMRSWRTRRLSSAPPFTDDVLERSFAKLKT
jgi:hypothetical protein